ncbi:9277_t:CDS:2, partial [Scutellospora calospora]
LHQLDYYFRIKDQKILLLLDNTASHFDSNEEYTDQDKASSASENVYIELSNSIGSSSKKKTGILPAVENEKIINATEFQDETNLFENNELDTLLDEFSNEDDYSTALTSA